ncbi:MAG: Uncharacterized protein AVDCRST_MAG12-1378, partial [uncultured Rubrobacteraceae bacterium]
GGGAQHRGAYGRGDGRRLGVGAGQDTGRHGGLRRPRPHRGRRGRPDDERRGDAQEDGGRRHRAEHSLPPERPERPRRLLRPERGDLERPRGAPGLVRAVLQAQPAPGLRGRVRPVPGPGFHGPQAAPRLPEIRARRPAGGPALRDGRGGGPAGPDPRGLRHGAHSGAPAAYGRAPPGAAPYPRPRRDGRGARSRPTVRGPPERALRDLGGAGQGPLRPLLDARPLAHKLRVGHTLRGPPLDAARDPRRRGRRGRAGRCAAGHPLGQHPEVVPV